MAAADSDTTGTSRGSESLTYDEFGRRPQDPTEEWVGGQIHRLPDPSTEHTRLREFLFALLERFVDRGRAGAVFSGVRMKLPIASGRVPDLIVVLNENRARPWGSELDGPADLVIEILRQGADPADHGQKFYEYEAGGVREYWVIDQQRKAAEFYVAVAPGQLRGRSAVGGVFRSEALPGLVLRTDWLWTLPDPEMVRST